MAKHHSIKQIAEALYAHDGMFSPAARALKMTREGVADRVRRSAELRRVVDDIENAMLDTAEGNVAKALKAEDGAMTRWLLERKGRNRGYGTKIDQNNTFDENQLEAFASALGGNPKKLRSALEHIRAQRAAGGMGRP